MLSECIQAESSAISPILGCPPRTLELRILNRTHGDKRQPAAYPAPRNVGSAKKLLAKTIKFSSSRKQGALVDRASQTLPTERTEMFSRIFP